ncbi:putative transcription factor bHLH family [Lupinus albus]|uniref:Putative transcription factor bHLH family n=1 Tax=Lupinus albus TaxID=3870 RepID=A0A6A4NU08_LUPAL|nr:putative transcription factor bHLH family [Lupinus albus]
MGHAYDDRLYVSLDELLDFNGENGSNRGRMGKKNYDNGETTVFKSKNLETERRRREKLSSRLLMLRSLVPIITNMNKLTIVDDAITYIKVLQDKVQNLSQELYEIDATLEEIPEPKIVEVDDAQEMKNWGIQEEVRVTQIGENKLWVKMVIEKKRGRFRKLMEAMNGFGMEYIDTSVTSIKGAFLITACIRVTLT